MPILIFCHGPEAISKNQACISSLMVEKLAIPLQDTRLWMVKGRFLVHITNPEKKDKLEEWAKVRKMRQMGQRSC